MKYSDPVSQLQRLHFPCLPRKRTSFLRQNQGYHHQGYRVPDAKEAHAREVLIQTAQWRVFRYGEKRGNQEILVVKIV